MNTIYRWKHVKKYEVTDDEFNLNTVRCWLSEVCWRWNNIPHWLMMQVTVTERVELDTELKKFHWVLAGAPVEALKTEDARRPLRYGTERCRSPRWMIMMIGRAGSRLGGDTVRLPAASAVPVSERGWCIDVWISVVCPDGISRFLCDKFQVIGVRYPPASWWGDEVVHSSVGAAPTLSTLWRDTISAGEIQWF